MSIDGYCDHTAMNPGEEVHDHFSELIRNGSAILYGRKTYELMTFWKTLLEKPSGDKSMDDFARAIDSIPKIVFSHTMKDKGEAVDWTSARLSERTPEEEVKTLMQQPGKDILVGSRSLIIHLLNLGIIDELQLCVHPVLAGSGLPLFEQLKGRTELHLEKTKVFACGAVNLYYRPDNSIRRSSQ